ncbi:MAG: DUF3108 domain-containing protein [Cytophagaceae bacterium]|jgi:hypothetical protein|nr:DUF3108 domain-containing protein [Cytophagaceae bacterium]
MKTLGLFVALSIGLVAFTNQTSEVTVTKALPYTGNEVLQYRLHYGFINAGEATIMVHPTLYAVNGKVCYKTTVSGKSTGSFAMMMTIKDEWGSYIDTNSRIPQKAYRDITENSYRLKEVVMYDYGHNKANVIREKGKDLSNKSTHEYAIAPNLQDIVSGAYYLRSLDYTTMAPGTPIAMKAFFEDKLYDFTIKFVGREKIDTKWGKINAIKLQPVMPNNEMFDGGNSIRVWISDDKNKIPIRMEADMFVGKVAVDLKGYSGLKHTIAFQK